MIRASYTVATRGERSSSPETTGDLVLFAEPRGVRVSYDWGGGVERSRGTTVIKALLPQTVRIVAETREFGSGAVMVPVKANCITTVRFVFAGPKRQARR